MPLTVPAHQLFAIPLLRRLPGTAVMVGTVVPDIAFVVGGYSASTPAHEPYGPLLFAPTLGLALYLYAELLLAPALRTIVPERWARLFVTRGLPRTLSGWAWVIVSLLAGAITHVAVDGFTHHWMWPARDLYGEVRVFGPLRLTQLMQHTTSLVASIATIVWARRRIRTLPPIDERPDWRRRLVRTLVVALAGAGVGLAGGLLVWGTPVVPHDYATLLCPMVDVALIAATLAMRTPRAPRRDASGGTAAA